MFSRRDCCLGPLVLIVALLASAGCRAAPAPTQQAPAATEKPRDEAPTEPADADQLYDALWRAKKARHEQLYIDTARRIEAEVPAEDLIRLLEAAAGEMLRAEAEDDWYRAGDFREMVEALAAIVFRKGPGTLRVLVDRVAELGTWRREEGNLAFLAAYIATAYRTAEELQAAKQIVQDCPSVWAWFDEEGGYFSASDFDRPPYTGPPDDWADPYHPYSRPTPFAQLQAAFGEESHVTHGWEGEGIPWARSRYNPANWKVTASSAAAGHPAEACTDGDVATFWCPEDEDDDPWIRFEAPGVLKFYNAWNYNTNLLNIIPGAASDLETYLDHGRPTRIRIEYGDDTYRDYSIEYGTKGKSRTYFFEPHPRWDHEADSFCIRILEWEKGRVHSAPAISELWTHQPGGGADGPDEWIDPIILE